MCVFGVCVCLRVYVCVCVHGAYISSIYAKHSANRDITVDIGTAI